MTEPLPLVLGLLLVGAGDAPFFVDQERGWYWYELPPHTPDEVEPPPPPGAADSVPLPLSAREQLAAQGKAWEEAMATAVLEPTDANVRRYLELTAAINGQAQRFASAFQSTLWLEPQLDYTLQSPVSTQAIIAKNEQQSVAHAAALGRVSQEAGLVFVYRGDCAVCHRFAPILHRFAATYGFAVVPVSIDGGSLPEFPNPKSNHAFVANASITAVPALLLVNPESGEVAAVGYGYSDWTTLKQKVLHAAKRLGVVENVPDVFAAAIPGPHATSYVAPTGGLP